MKASPVFVFGDFNTPQSLVLKTRGYKLLTQNLTDVVAGDPFTFPAKSAAERKTFPPVEIDHGFTNGLQQVDAAEVLPLQGSDHYLLYFILRP